MTETPNEPSDKTPSSDPMGQADIDALLNGDAAPEPAGTANTEEVKASGNSEAVSQADIDALLNGDAAPEPAGAVNAEEVKASEDSGAIGQADIDALLNGAADEKTTSGEEAAPDVRLDSQGRPFDEAAAAMAAAVEEERAAAQAAPPSTGPPPDTEPLQLGDLGPLSDAKIEAHRVSMLHDVSLRVKLELGRTRMRVEEVLKLDEGSVVELDKLAGDPVDVLVNDRLVARGEVLILNDNFCVRISDVLSEDPHRVSV